MNELLKQYEDWCKGHDWYYNYSDDHRFWIAGQKSAKVGIDLEKQLNNAGLSKERVEIWSQYCPWAGSED